MSAAGTTLRRAWKHPFHIDTWENLDAARAAHPHVLRFRRVWAHDGVIKRHSSGIIRDRFTLTWRRTMEEASPELLATAQAILSRRQQRQILPAAALWPVIVEDVRALALEQPNETALLRVLYRLIFHTPLP
jgi:hypothetical protein